MDDQTVQVHVRVSDFGTNQPTPVRIRFECADRSTPAPLGRLAHFSHQRGLDHGGQLFLHGKNYHIIDGSCEVRLLPGPIKVEISKGPNYTPVDQIFHVSEGQIALRLTIHRQSDWRSSFWFSGDTRVQYLPPHAALLESQAEDIDVVNLLALEEPDSQGQLSTITNLLAFSGTEPLLQSSDNLITVNTLNIHPLRGSLALLNSHRPVYPLRAGEMDGYSEWSVEAWCQQCHRKKGVVVWSDLPRLTMANPQTEALAVAVLGGIDTWEISKIPEPNWTDLEPYYELLDLGLSIGLVGGSGKDRSTIPIGQVRTYAFLDVNNPFSYSSWMEAVRKSQTFATSGPFLQFQVNDQQPGGLLSTDGESNHLPVMIRVQSEMPGILELLINHEVRMTAEQMIQQQFHLENDSWIAARWRSVDGSHFSHTSPIWWKGTNQPSSIQAKSIGRLKNRLDQGQEWTHHHGLRGEKASDFDRVIELAREKLDHQLNRVRNR